MTAKTKLSEAQARIIGAVAIKFDDGTTQVVPASDLTVPANTNENEA